MADETVDAKTTLESGEEASASVVYDFGNDLANAVDIFGEDVAFSRLKSAITIDLQGYVRGLLKQGKTADEITAAVEEWKPGIRKAGKSKAEKLAELLAGMSEEERNTALETFL